MLICEVQVSIKPWSISSSSKAFTCCDTSSYTPGLRFPFYGGLASAFTFLSNPVDTQARLAPLGLQAIDLAPGVRPLRKQQAGLGKLKLFSRQGGKFLT